LFKKASHILPILTVCIGLFFSCKGKKEASAQKEVKGGIDQATELRFGMMYIDACSYRMKGNLEEAKKLFLECNKLMPANSAVKYELATIYKLLGVNEQALFYAKACATEDPKNEWYQLCLIECYRTIKQYKQSAKLLENLVKNYPAKMEFKEDLAIDYQRLGMLDKSLKIYDELERTIGVNEELSLRKAKLFTSLGKIKEAETELIRLSQSNATETRYYSHLADFYIEQKDLDKAKSMYDRILAIDPGNPIVNLALHDYYSSQGKTELAFDHLKKAFMNPDLDVFTKASITGSIFDNKMDLPYYREHAKELADILIMVHAEAPEANSIYGDFMMRAGNIKDAQKYYWNACSKERGNYSIWEKLINTDRKLGMYDSLEHHSAIAIEHFPGMPLFYYCNGSANITLKNYKKAAQSLKDGLEFVVDNSSLMIDFYKNLGDAYFFSGEFSKAYAAFDDVLKIDADNTFVLNQYACFLSLRGENLEKAEKLARKANELELENPSYMDTYGWILYQQKKFSEAELWLGNAAKGSSKNPNILEHYGDVLYQNGKKEEALKYWEDAKKAGGTSERLMGKIKTKKLSD